MGRPRKDPSMAGEYASKAKAWLCCDTCDRTIPYQGKADPDHGDGWPQHRCRDGKAAPFTRHTTTDPHPPIVRSWDDLDSGNPDRIVMIG